MQKLISILCMTLFIGTTAIGQLDFGILGGVHTFDVKSDPINVTDRETLDNLVLSIKEANLWTTSRGVP